MNLEKYFRKIKRTFEKNAYEGEYPIVCKISDYLVENNLTEEHEHNCIGCNLSTSLSHIYTYLLNPPTFAELDYIFKIYFYLNYLLVEQVSFVYSLFEKRGYLDEDDEFSSKYPYFIKVKRWTNFFKHPKYFMLVHHPEYIFEDHSDFNTLIDFNNNDLVIINDDFVRKYYKGDGNREKLCREIANKSYVVVVFPSLIKLTEGFCKDLNRFIENVLANEDYIKIIRDDATCENYFALFENEIE